ncbi:MAG: (Fe-S)-binding protein [Deltaproteobacteria bacterium]|nr:MAG: (Fe-S)-binding protein [Deltaproteobacteria bacterium]
MHPTGMLTMLVGLFAAFCWSANRRWQLLKVGRDAARLDQLVERIKGTLVYAFFQKKMGQYPAAGLAHKIIFFGFLILLLRSLMLWGRGFSPEFNLWVLGPEPLDLPLLGPVALGHLYDFLKDIAALAVLLGAAYFLYLRLGNRAPRMTQSREAVLILIIIIVMMIGDMAYDGAAQVLYERHYLDVCKGGQAELCASIATVASHLGPVPSATAAAVQWAGYPTPVGSIFAILFQGFSPDSLIIIAHLGFWVHASLVMIFLNLLPHSKHFHVITVIPNVFARDLGHPGALPHVGTAEELGEKVMAAYENPDTAEPIGASRIEHFTWKGLLDLYTCTECGRCSDNCPAHRTGKLLSPKQLLINLRDHLYSREDEFLNRAGGPKGESDDGHGDDHAAETEEDASNHEAEHDSDHEHEGDDHGHHEPVYPDNPIPVPEVESEPVDLVGNVIHPDVLWGCTTCRACEEVCPVLNTHVDKIIDMRRNLALIKGEFPQELGMPFQGIEVNGNPWDLARLDRGAWAEGLDIPTAADRPDAPVLLWVGCASSYDDRAKKIARATAKLLKAADVDFVILGEEENCTGDPARRAGNEYLFAMMAEQNIATLNRYQEQGGVKTIVAACPHCFNTLANEYPDFGGKYDVVHHSDYLLGLIAEKKLVPHKKIKSRVVYHDSCYLGRYNNIYEQPRLVLESIPGVELVEPDEATGNLGQCCGAGGMQMFMEEQNKDRMMVQRTLQLLETGADTIASACPFCVTMLTDGLKDQDKEEDIRQLDIAELLAESCALD